jgi:hypothetical protein
MDGKQFSQLNDLHAHLAAFLASSAAATRVRYRLLARHVVAPGRMFNIGSEASTFER